MDDEKEQVADNDDDDKDSADETITIPGHRQVKTVLEIADGVQSVHTLLCIRVWRSVNDPSTAKSKLSNIQNVEV